jgi:hypothetical protein
MTHKNKNAGAVSGVFIQRISKLADELRQYMQMMLVSYFEHKNIIPLMSIACNFLVGMKGLEPSRPKALVPKTSVYTNFTTSPYLSLEYSSILPDTTDNFYS